MKRIIRQIVGERLATLTDSLGVTDLPYYEIEVPKNAGHGDFSTNAAMLLARQARKNPREIAMRVVDGFSHPLFAKIDIAGPGFINFYLDHSSLMRFFASITADFGAFLSPRDEKRHKILIEYVSANPTGPLHVGHGRGACLGSALSRILSEMGHEVWQEFYINDAGAQVRNLGLSILLRLRQQRGETVDFPDGCYMGDYVSELAVAFAALEPDTELTEENIARASLFGREIMLDEIRKDLADFNVVFDSYVSEKALFTGGTVDECLDFLRERGLTFRKDGALWFRSAEFGDDKDRVLIKETGEKTYFASDVAYHRQKYGRDFDRYVNIWGADHHGYVPRVKAAIKAMGYDPEKLGIIMVQMVNLYREGKPVTMSKRAGDFVTMREVLDEVGKDAMRFMFLTRKRDSALDFDIDAVKRKTSDNPVFYVQYMYARINSVFNVAGEKGIRIREIPVFFDRLELDIEKQLVMALLSFPDAVSDACRHLEPHNITYYLINLAQLFHSYYNACKFINEDDRDLTVSRLNLLRYLKEVVNKGLTLLGVDSPERM